MREIKLSRLKEQRGKLIDAWLTANSKQKGSLVVKISDIDDELERRKALSSQDQSQ